MNSGSNVMRLTIGDLVVAVTDAAFEVSKDEKEAYQIAAAVLNENLQFFFSEGRRLGFRFLRERNDSLAVTSKVAKV